MDTFSSCILYVYSCSSTQLDHFSTSIPAEQCNCVLDQHLFCQLLICVDPTTFNDNLQVAKIRFPSFNC